MEISPPVTSIAFVLRLNSLLSRSMGLVELWVAKTRSRSAVNLRLWGSGGIDL